MIRCTGTEKSKTPKLGDYLRQTHTLTNPVWKELLDVHWDYRHTTHIIWENIHGLSNRTPSLTLNTSITFNNKLTTTHKNILNCFIKQFTNTQHTRQTNPLTEQYIKYKDIALYYHNSRGNETK